MQMSCLFLALTCSLIVGDAITAQAQHPIAAKLGGEAVYVAEAEAELKRAYGAREFAAEERGAYLRAALDQVIDRRLVLAYLTKTGQAASKQDVDLALAQFENDLKSQSLTLPVHLKQVGLSVEEVRRALAWKLSWQRYLEKQLTEANLEKYFVRQRREFDGTRLRVGQILIALPTGAGEEAILAAKARADSIKQEIAAGKLSFAEAARQHSQAPSSKAGGDIGWIERRHPMPEEFSRIAFALKAGELSEVFVSPFGVHLITILEEKAGDKSWRDVEAELRPAVTLYLFRWIADQERKSAKIEYAP